MRNSRTIVNFVLMSMILTIVLCLYCYMKARHKKGNSHSSQFCPTLDFGGSLDMNTIPIYNFFLYFWNKVSTASCNGLRSSYLGEKMWSLVTEQNINVIAFCNWNTASWSSWHDEILKNNNACRVEWQVPAVISQSGEPELEVLESYRKYSA